jgi:hypothetical protein
MPNYTSTAMLTVLVAVGSGEAARIATKKPMVMTPVIGGFALGIFLFAFGMVSQPLAVKFCILIIVASLLKNGVAITSLMH